MKAGKIKKLIDTGKAYKCKRFINGKWEKWKVYKDIDGELVFIKIEKVKE